MTTNSKNSNSQNSNSQNASFKNNSSKNHDSIAMTNIENQNLEQISAPTNNARAIIINVDDLGLSEAVNHAVIRLAERGLIGASSYMVGGNISTDDTNRLSELKVDVGLHLDLTGIFPSALLGSLKPLLITSYLRRLKPLIVTDIINRQLDRFADTFGRAPVFIDGHQHIHQFPIVRQQLIKALDTRFGDTNDSAQNAICARVTTPLVNDLKSQVIYRLGGKAWRKLCADNNITTNDKFGGVYGFDADTEQLSVLWDQWLSAAPRTRFLTPGLHNLATHLAPQGTYSQYGSTTPAIHSVPLGLPRDIKTSLIMCHPAAPDNSWHDDIKQAREREFEWLMSYQFEDLLLQNEVRLMSWSDIAKGN